MKTEREGGKKGKLGEGKKGRFGKIFPSNATKKKKKILTLNTDQLY